MHLPGKEALLDGLVDSIAREIEAEIGRLPVVKGWQLALRQRCLAAPMHALGSMTLGFVQKLFSPAGGNAATDLSEAQFAQMAAMLPHVTAMVASEIHAHDGDTLGWCDSQASSSSLSTFCSRASSASAEQRHVLQPCDVLNGNLVQE